MSSIDISDSVAKQTVRCDRPITGKQLIDAVRSTCIAPSSGSRTLGRYGVDDEVKPVLDLADSLERTVRQGPEITAGLTRSPAPRAAAAAATSRDLKDPLRTWDRPKNHGYDRHQ